MKNDDGLRAAAQNDLIRPLLDEIESALALMRLANWSANPVTRSRSFGAAQESMHRAHYILEGLNLSPSETQWVRAALDPLERWLRERSQNSSK